MSGQDNAGTDAPDNEDINTGADTDDQNDDQNIEDQDDDTDDQDQWGDDQDDSDDQDKWDDKKEPKKNVKSSKNQTIKTLRDENKKLKADAKAAADAKLAEEGKYKELYEDSKKTIEDLQPKAEKWDGHQAQVSAKQDVEIKDLEKKLWKDILTEKSTILNSFSDKWLKIDYLKDLAVAKGKGSYKASPDGGGWVDKLSGKQILDKYEWTPNWLWKALLASAKAKK